jgi:DNA-binding ferritin-like protein
MSYTIQKQAPLMSVVAALRAVAQLHQSHHWQARGVSYYGDHLLFERLYNDAQGGIDAVAERTVGLFGPDWVDAQQLVEATQRHLAEVNEMARGVAIHDSGMVRLSLAAEMALVEQIGKVKELLRAQGKLSGGTANLLDGIADQHEQSIYLLKQRLL